MMDLKNLKEKVISEINIRSLSDSKIYAFVVNELFFGNVKKADSFMVSKEMGYTTGDLNKLKLNNK